ncbi:MAG: hypothetical protein ACK4K7_00470 [Allosphingosinicella sp.]|uniref:hypothetical protein n=1 Tax=Allosphingosinicella sp. TaxID=2823234 RepID=UPI0039476880
MLMPAGCLDIFGTDSREEVAWADAPDGLTHAILLETNGGATTSYGYEIELHPAPHQGEQPVPAGRLYGAVRNGCASGVTLRWLSPTELVLDFSEARDVDVPAQVMVGGRAIAVIPRSGVSDPGAPCGSMGAHRS